MLNHSDTEKDDLSTTPFLHTSNESIPHPRSSPWRDLRLVLTVIASLLLTNVFTFTLTRYSATESQPSVSEPPKGVPHTFSSLPRTTLPKLLNSTLYSSTTSTATIHHWKLTRHGETSLLPMVSSTYRRVTKHSLISILIVTCTGTSQSKGW